MEVNQDTFYWIFVSAKDVQVHDFNELSPDCETQACYFKKLLSDPIRQNHTDPLEADSSAEQSKL